MSSESQVLSFLLGLEFGLLSLGLSGTNNVVGGTDCSSCFLGSGLCLGLDLETLLVADICGRLVGEELFISDVHLVI